MIPTGVALFALLIATLTGWRRPVPDGTGRRMGAEPAALPAAAAQARQFFGWASSATWRPLTNTGNPFFTLAIQPPPPPTPPPAAPSTRKLDLVYRGFFETSARVRRAVVQVADKQVIAGKGERVVADYSVADIQLGHLGMTNAAGVAAKLDFSKAAQIEVPAK
ncbi:MAG: hypothetical protein JNL97_09035 [Verrucomicrobiales bacterium]|nr:hypothetical protein [Verrucomicrobiales bacterium]